MPKRLLALLVLIALLLVGCNHKSGHASQRASSLASNPAVQADKAEAKKIIAPCLPADQLTLIHKPARTTMLDCIVPNNPAVRAQLEQCANSALLADHIVTKTGRTQFLDGANPKQPSLVACVVRYAGKKGK